MVAVSPQYLPFQDSNQFHAVCLDTFPPIFYLNDTSKYIIQLVTQYNQYKGGVAAAYTFDAGPNAVIFAEKENIPELLSVILNYLPSTPRLIVFEGVHNYKSRMM